MMNEGRWTLSLALAICCACCLLAARPSLANRAFNTLFPGRHYQHIYHDLDSKLCRVVKSKDPEINMNKVVRWYVRYKKNPLAYLWLSKVHGYEQLVSLSGGEIIGCGEESVENIKYNERALRKCFHQDRVNQQIKPCERLESVVKFYTEKQANYCRERLPIDWANKQRQLNATVGSIVGGAMDQFIDSLARVDIQSTQNASSTTLQFNQNVYKLLLQLDASIPDEPKSVVAGIRERILPDGNELGWLARIKSFKRRIVGPCKELVRELGADVFESAEFYDTKVERRLVGEKDDTQEMSDFYRAWAHYNLCKSVLKFRLWKLG